MKNIIVLFALLFCVSIAQAQDKPILQPAEQPVGNEAIKNSVQALPLRPNVPSRGEVVFTPQSVGTILRTGVDRGITSQITPHPVSGRPAWIKLKGQGLSQGSHQEQCLNWFDVLGESWGVKEPNESFVLLNDRLDDLGNHHLHWQQQQSGIPVYGNDLKAHFQDGKLFLMNGRVLPDVEIELNAEITESEAVDLAKVAVQRHTNLKELSAQEKLWLGTSTLETELVIFYNDDLLKEPHLAWWVTIYPNLGAHWEFMVDAHSGEILRELDHVCHLLPPPNGPKVTTATDLLGQSRTIHSYEQDNTTFLIDASRTMFDASNSSFPDDGQGVIWTINGNNTSPAGSDFQATHVVSSGNFWNDPLAVSAHYNSGQAYRYYKETFNRNSINGQGGNILSFINVADDDGSDMDNAFWNGQAMFYGNGNTDFTSPLAKSLDVAGHEMSHGVIQSTANLEYQGESGALNESFADVFAAMIDRDDWKIGEGIVNTSVFPTNALRDLSNPHNGGSQLGSAGWQPEHTNEQYHGSQDNGGVHINSGIPNRAFFLFATAVGKTKAEQVYYRALNVYLTRSSGFLDMRASIIQAALDLYGQSEADAAAVAFTTVGIGSGNSGGNGGGTPSTTFDDLSINPGEDFVLFTEANYNDLFIRTPDGTDIANPLSSLNPISKPSITDDGSAIVFVDEDNHMRAILIDWVANEVTDVLTLSASGIWRNMAISKDGNRIAGLTTNNDNEVWVFDFSQSGSVPSQNYELYNPTFSEGVTTGNVEYADVLEWDHSGQYIMYDALNVIPNQNGTEIDYWDIGFMNVWNNGSNNFGDGTVSKLFNSLPENTSVGNPTFSKNSPYITAFDFIDNNDNSYFILASNIETGDVNTLRENFELGYPNYSNQDDQVIFNAENTSGDNVIGSIAVGTDKITAVGDPFVLISNGFLGASWGTWFANGQRNLVNTDNLRSVDSWAKVFPTVSQGQIELEWEIDQASQIDIKVTDLLGRNHWQKSERFSVGKHQESLSLDLPVGVYLVNIETESRSFVQRVIVK